MPIIVELVIVAEKVSVKPIADVLVTSEEGPVLTADITTVDDCPVLNKMKAFLVEQNTFKTLEWIIRDRNGKPRNLSDGLPLPPSSISSPGSQSSAGSISSESSFSGSFSSASSPALSDSFTVKMRARQILAPKFSHRPSENIFEVEAYLVVPEEGVVQARIGPTLTKYTGIYGLDWGIYNSNGALIYVDTAYMSVEPNLFINNLMTLTEGPPTLQEVRLSIRDHAPENLFLDNVEFDAAEVVQSIIRCVSYWNEVPPPLRRETAHTFPFKDHWLKGVQAYLFELAAHHYRRVSLKYTAGGNQVADKDKEVEYARAAQMLKQEWQDWVAHKKLEINMRSMVSNIGSVYGRRA